MRTAGTFRRDLRAAFDEFCTTQSRRFPERETIRIDLHCHDLNSDVPDELLGRILRWPETWVTTGQLLDTLRAAGTDAITVTNHNNARSCWQLLDKGVDVLVGAEFTCTVPEHDVQLHVLTYGFTPEQEHRLLALRRNLYRFLAWARDHDLVTVLAHPLFFYGRESVPPLELVEKLTLLFDNFEVMNGQRDTWQNMLMASWLDGLDEERILDMSRRTGVDPWAFTRRPFDKRMTGGSDCHMAMFAGTSGTLLHVPDLAERAREEPLSVLAMEALRNGAAAPYGRYTHGGKLAASFLDYFCQVAMHMEDPGLVRMLLHKGTTTDKLIALLITNGVMEIRRHGYTSRFLRTAHDALRGKRPGIIIRRGTGKQFRPLVRELDEIARARRRGPEDLEERLHRSLPAMFRQINEILAERISRKVQRYGHLDELTPESATDLVGRLEIPANLRILFEGHRDGHRERMSRVNLAELADGLPFPLLAAAVLGGSSFTASRVMFNSRRLLDDFSAAVGCWRHPERALWLTDTLADRNGIASSLRLLHTEAVRRDLPIDLAVCGGDVEPDDHLVVLKPVIEFETPIYEQQPFRIPDLMEVQRVFVEGGYDRIVCSTEAPAGLVGLYLKQAFSVPAYFYVHTDWIDFAHRTLRFDTQSLDRLRRLLRAFYRCFDGLFVLCEEHEKWLAGRSMEIPEDAIHRTAHWVDRDVFRPHPVSRESALPGVAPDEPVALYAGRVSKEKGVMDLPGFLARLRERVPGARLVVAGTGPAEAELRELMPDAVFLGWVDKDRLARCYSAANVLVLPSRFDTFGNVVLEAMSCGLPVVAYSAKGPRDIIEHGRSGYLAGDPASLAELAGRILADREIRRKTSAGAISRAASYTADSILDSLLRDLGLSEEAAEVGTAPSVESDLVSTLSIA